MTNAARAAACRIVALWDCNCAQTPNALTYTLHCGYKFSMMPWTAWLRIALYYVELIWVQTLISSHHCPSSSSHCLKMTKRTTKTLYPEFSVPCLVRSYLKMIMEKHEIVVSWCDKWCRPSTQSQHWCCLTFPALSATLIYDLQRCCCLYAFPPSLAPPLGNAKWPCLSATFRSDCLHVQKPGPGN